MELLAVFHVLNRGVSENHAAACRLKDAAPTKGQACTGTRSTVTDGEYHDKLCMFPATSTAGIVLLGHTTNQQ